MGMPKHRRNGAQRNRIKLDRGRIFAPWSDMAEVLSTFLLQRGAAAPGFTLPDADAVSHSLADLRGANGLLVVFACNHCPFVVHLADAFGAFAAEAAELGVSTVAIIRHDVYRSPAAGPDEMKQFAAEPGWDFPY